MANRKREKKLTIRLTEEEFNIIENKRKLTKKSQTDFILSCINKKPIIVIDGVMEILAEMKREGNNLNQAIRFAHEYGSLDTSYLNQTLNELRFLYKQMLDINKGKIENANFKMFGEQSDSEKNN